MNHVEYSAYSRRKSGRATECAAHYITFGGRCLNCGFDPDRCHRAEVKRDCPLNHRWNGKEARHR